MQVAGRVRHANQILSGKACHSAQDDKCKVCRRLTSLEAEIRHAQSSLQTLLNERDVLHARHDGNHFSIFDRLPVEVASIIFSLYLSNLARKKSQFTLGAVCQRWREIVWSTPNFWSNLTACFSGSKRVLTETRVQLIKSWLSRSGSLPLSISLDVLSPYAGGSNQRPLKRLAEILNSFCDRWYDLDLTMPSKALVFLDSSACKSPRLHTLSLRSDDGEVFIPTVFNLRPQVVNIGCVQLDPSSLDWTRVTHFTASVFPVELILQILQMAPNLREAQFEFVRFEYGGLDASIHVTHRELRDLDIEFSLQEAEECFLSNVTLPGLELLDIKSNDGGEHVDFLAPFFARSSCPLQCLTLRGSEYPGDDLVRISRSLPSLEELYIMYGFAKEDNIIPFSRALQNGPSDEDTSIAIPAESKVPILPCLRIFEWNGIGPFPWDIIPHFFTPLSSNNRHSCRPLESITINCGNEENSTASNVNEDALSQLSNFAKEVAFDLTAVVGNDPGSSTEISLDRRV